MYATIRMGLCRRDHAPQGIAWDSAAATPEAEVADFLEAFGQDVLEEAADKLDHPETGGSEASASGFTVGKGDGAVFERDDTAVGDGDPEDIRGEVFEGGVAVWSGPRGSHLDASVFLTASSAWPSYTGMKPTALAGGRSRSKR